MDCLLVLSTTLIVNCDLPQPIKNILSVLKKEVLLEGLGIPQKALFNHLAKMPAMAKWANSDLFKGFLEIRADMS